VVGFSLSGKASPPVPSPGLSTLKCASHVLRPGLCDIGGVSFFHSDYSRNVTCHPKISLLMWPGFLVPVLVLAAVYCTQSQAALCFTDAHEFCVSTFYFIFVFPLLPGSRHKSLRETVRSVNHLKPYNLQGLQVPLSCENKLSSSDLGYELVYYFL
jgi:hypothetical protein